MMSNNYPDGLSDTTPGTPWNPKENIDPDVVKEAIDTAEHLMELLDTLKTDAPSVFKNSWEMDGTLSACSKIIKCLESLEKEC